MQAATTGTSQQGGSTWLQTDPLTFRHDLTGADRDYEPVSDVPELTIPFPGVWEISYLARPAISVSTNAALWVTTALFKNNALIPGSEAITGLQASDEVIQNTTGQTFLHKFDAGDRVTLHAYRIGQTGTANILSNADGRTGVMAHWVSPGF
ncbi:hypothetical protein ABZ801_11950 [Actinomadura sp. NPDC047616]|uniref:hypothetical protein n=1 Tax=Actinomadura sp. NPDC047616 TaxID=3155914 RepID=UPI0033C37273